MQAADDRLVDKYNFFIFEVVKAHMAPGAAAPADPALYRRWRFVVSGKIISRHSQFRPELLSTLDRRLLRRWRLVTQPPP
jgi:hypothetical protein